MVSKSPESAQGVGLVILFPLAIVSNALVPTEHMPAVLRTIADWNPVSAVTAAAAELFGNPNPSASDPRLADAAPGPRLAAVVGRADRGLRAAGQRTCTGAAPPTDAINAPTSASHRGSSPHPTRALVGLSLQPTSAAVPGELRGSRRLPIGSVGSVAGARCAPGDLRDSRWAGVRTGFQLPAVLTTPANRASALRWAGDRAPISGQHSWRQALAERRGVAGDAWGRTESSRPPGPVDA